MAPKQPCISYKFVPGGVHVSTPNEPPRFVTPQGPKTEENVAEYTSGGYLPIQPGDTFRDRRYKVIRKLGWGHFSTVWLVKDNRNKCHSALKVVKSAGRYAETARDEVKLLSRALSFSKTHPGREHIVSFLDSFSHQGPEASHVCIVFEPLGENLLGLIERHKKKGVPRPLVKMIARQILLGLEYLHDECDLVHTDIKPENILISIPDIEAHIYNELSSSPSPVSTRVVLPQRRTAGVSIPQKHQQKQVTIVHSQPLSSPGRSLGKSLNPLTSMSIKLKHEDVPSEKPKESVSFPASTQPTRTIGYLGYSGTVGALSSNAARLMNNLSAAQNDSVFDDKKLAELTAAKATAAVPSANCPSSSSSSSSSISSVIGVTSPGSTPPTSLPHSLGTTVTEFLGLGIGKAAPKEGKAIQEMKKESELGVISSSWKVTTEIVGSFKDRVSAFAKSTSSPSVSKKPPPPPTERSHSGIPGNGFFPGTGGPAPAILVSAVVNADRQQVDFTKDSNVDAIGPMSTAPSATGTAARPIPIGTMPKSKLGRDTLSDDSATIHGISPIRDTSSTKTDITVSQVSLLTRTAPVRTTSSKRTDIRVSPAQHISYISANMYSHKPSQADVRTTTKSRTTPRVSHNPVAIGTAAGSSTSVTPTPPSPAEHAPSAPPPTPVDPSSISTQIPDAPVAEGGVASTATAAEQTENDVVHAPPISVKIADLGNATPSRKHFTEDIQTRQYRAPEAILGRTDWDARADIWSVACVVFELLTTDYLFDPKGQGEMFNKDDDHMAQIIELVGDFPLSAKMDGRFSRELFDISGSLRYIKTLKSWPLRRVLMEKYLYPESEAATLCSFLEPMLQPDMRMRARARDLKDNTWLTITEADGVVLEW